MTARADRLHHDNATAHSTALVHGFSAKDHITQVCQPPSPQSPDLAPCDFWLFPKLKSPLKGRRCDCDGHTVHKLSQQRLTADWLASRESECSRMRSKVSSDCLPSYVKATRPVLEIFKTFGYFLDSPRICIHWLYGYRYTVSSFVQYVVTVAKLNLCLYTIFFLF